MKKPFLTTIFFLCSWTILAQGFYNSNDLLINKKAIKKLSIYSVTATADWLDTEYHLMNDFAFEYRFNENGEINYRKYWESDLLDNDKYMNVMLILDTGIIDTGSYNLAEKGKLKYKRLGQSKEIKYNQNKRHTKQFISKLERKFTSINPPNNDYLERRSYRNDLIDTVLLNKKVCIPQWLLPRGDSIVYKKNVILTFVEYNGVIKLNHKLYITESDSIQIEWMSLSSPNTVWRNHYINSAGFLYKKDQNVYSTIYSYDGDNLHIKTETYRKNTKTTMTTFKYN